MLSQTLMPQIAMKLLAIKKNLLKTATILQLLHHIVGKRDKTPLLINLNFM